ncbi:hypothetical protein MTR67_025609 [Solanum verrucosum]|uniref:Uncharacterized protein n=1 Tax=Solanum verrucosum TaxID=315347 RepID=A0AAF0R648_SOLVR|nr:hypothetical protein MTR67_025609 [Solanum verrucosum]
MVGDMRSRISLFVAGLSRLSSKEGRAAMLIGDMDISRLMVYVQQQKQKGPATLSASAPAPKNEGEYNSQNSQHFRAKPGLLQVLTVVEPTQGNRAQSSSVALPDKLHLDELLPVLEEEPTVFMRSLVTKSKRTL